MTAPLPPSKAGPLPAARVTSLDGVRGVAACAVAAFHFLYAFRPDVYARERTGFSLDDLPVAALWNGHFAVAVFFALSGFVLAASSPRSLREAPLMIGLRYVRLAVPALISSAIAWAWLTGFPDAGRAAQALSGSSWFRWTYQPPIPPLSQALWEGGIGVFLDGTTRFNNPLWTMRAELIGSLLIYGSYALLKGRTRAPAMVLGMVGFGLAEVYFLVAFCGGALVFELRDRLRDNAPVGWLLFALALTAGGIIPGHAAGSGLIGPVWPYLGAYGVCDIAAILLIVSVLITPGLRGFFEHALLQRLGEMSFPLYLVHVPLIVAPAAFVFDRFSPLSPPGLAGLFIAVCIGSLVLAWGFLVCVERPLLGSLRRLRTRGRARLAAL